MTLRIWSLQSVQSIGAALGSGAGEVVAAASSPTVSAKEAQPASPRLRTSRAEETAIRPRCRRMITSVGGGRAERRRSLPIGRPVTCTSAGQHLAQGVAHRHLELVVRAAHGVPVRAPAEELAGVTKPT